MKKMMAFVVVFSAFVFSTSAPDELQTTLAQKYENTVLILLHPVDSNSQTYNAAGQLLSSAKPAPWTINGSLEIKRVELTPEKLVIEGHWQLLAYDQRRHAMVPMNKREKKKAQAKLEIVLDAPLRSVDEAESVLHRIFAFNNEEFIDSVPEYWRPFLKKQNDRSQPLTSTSVASAKRSKSRSKILDPDKQVIIAGHSVTYPKPIYTPEPSFPSEVRAASDQGVVVLSAVIDETGKVTNPIILRPLGMGLDEKAIQTVQTWKFKPGTRDGKPAPIEMGLEISLNLY